MKIEFDFLDIEEAKTVITDIAESIVRYMNEDDVKRFIKHMKETTNNLEDDMKN